jgi:hypothetical protein
VAARDVMLVFVVLAAIAIAAGVRAVLRTSIPLGAARPGVPARTPAG